MKVKYQVYIPNFVGEREEEKRKKKKLMNMLFYWTQLSKYPNNFVLKKSVTTYLNRIKPQIKKKKKNSHVYVLYDIYDSTI